MPPLSVWAIRLAFLYLLIGFALGLLMFAAPFQLAIWPVHVLLSLHIDFLLYGFMLQMVMGVAYRILPRSGNRRRRRGWAVVGIAALNLSIVLPITGWLGDVNLFLAARGLLVVAILLFAVHAWPRIRGVRVKKGT